MYDTQEPTAGVVDVPHRQPLVAFFGRQFDAAVQITDRRARRGGRLPHLSVVVRIERDSSAKRSRNSRQPTALVVGEFEAPTAEEAPSLSASLKSVSAASASGFTVTS